MVTLKVFSLWFINLVWYILQFIVAFAFDQIGRSSILNKFLWKRYFEKTVEKMSLLLILPYLGIIPLQTRIKLRRTLTGVLKCCKLEFVFKCQTRLSNSFRYKGPIPKGLTSGVVYKLRCGLQWVLLWWMYQTRTSKIWGTHWCVTSC